MPAPHFDDIQEIVDERVIEVSGTVDITEEYFPVEMMVGVVQVKETKDAQGNKDYDLVAGAYGIGVPNAAPLGRGQMSTQSKWSMYLQLDSDETKRDFKEANAIGFVLVRQTGGAFTGWVDQIELRKKKKAASSADTDSASITNDLAERVAIKA